MAERWSREVIPDPEPVALEPGHPWEGRKLRAFWVRWTSSEGRVRWTWRVEAT